ncbi:hypothetical protein CBA19CS11_04990 [Caballeronia novacaledonica]|nr:hypothetical protein CBA19CS11_04990 [Caballeronia novacaledonica]
MYRMKFSWKALERENHLWRPMLKLDARIANECFEESKSAAASVTSRECFGLPITLTKQ